MKKTLLKIASLLLALCMLLPLAACEQEDAPAASGNSAGVKAEDLFYTLQTKVTFDTELEDVGDSALIQYIELPETAQVTMFSGSARYADELTWIRLAKESDMDAALDAVEVHKDEKYQQFMNYQAGEVPKIEAICIWHQGTDIIVCITGDYTNAKAIMNDPSKVVKASGSSAEPQATEPTATDAPVVDDPTEPATEPPVTEPPVVGYPVLTSQSGTWRDCGNAMIVDNMAYEYYGYSESAAKSYTSLVSKVGQQLQGQADVYCLVIPTAVGVVFPDDVAEKYSGYEDQGARLEQIYGMLDSSVIPVNIFDKMMQHRDEYLYYRTDWHWSGIGAYYGYERFCEVKGITPYTMAQRTEHAYEGYLGPLYSQTCNKDAALSATPDTVYAYEPYFEEDVTMIYTDTNGNRISQEVIENGDNYGAGLKYLIFAAGDNPITEFTNTAITDGSVAIVVKESFGNAMMSYFVDHYSTVYEIDYRHWNGDLVDFAREVGADDIIFANNIGMVRSGYLIGLMDEIIP